MFISRLEKNGLKSRSKSSLEGEARQASRRATEGLLPSRTSRSGNQNVSDSSGGGPVSKREDPAGLEDRIGNLRGGCGPLPETEKSFFELRLGHDFSRVKIHDDAQAAELAGEMKASAFAYGQDVFLGASSRNSDWIDRRPLLAHELAHVAQQDILSPFIQCAGAVEGVEKLISADKPRFGMTEPFRIAYVKYLKDAKGKVADVLGNPFYEKKFVKAMYDILNLMVDDMDKNRIKVEFLSPKELKFEAQYNPLTNSIQLRIPASLDPEGPAFKPLTKPPKGEADPGKLLENIELEKAKKEFPMMAVDMLHEYTHLAADLKLEEKVKKGGAAVKTEEESYAEEVEAARHETYLYQILGLKAGKKEFMKKMFHLFQTASSKAVSLAEKTEKIIADKTIKTGIKSTYQDYYKGNTPLTMIKIVISKSDAAVMLYLPEGKTHKLGKLKKAPKNTDALADLLVERINGNSEAAAAVEKYTKTGSMQCLVFLNDQKVPLEIPLGFKK